MLAISIQSSYPDVWQVLGGHVEELVEAWTFQRKFGNVQRSNTTSEDTEQAPAFQNFVPGRRHTQAGHRYLVTLHECLCAHLLLFYLQVVLLRWGLKGMAWSVVPALPCPALPSPAPPAY